LAFEYDVIGLYGKARESRQSAWRLRSTTMGWPQLRGAHCDAPVEFPLVEFDLNAEVLKPYVTSIPIADPEEVSVYQYTYETVNSPKHVVTKGKKVSLVKFSDATTVTGKIPQFLFVCTLSEF
jgi:hypothetical protein